MLPHQIFPFVCPPSANIFTPLIFTFLLREFFVVDSELEMADNPAVETQPTSPSRLSDPFYDQTFSSPSNEELAATLAIERQYTSCQVGGGRRRGPSASPHITPTKLRTQINLTERGKDFDPDFTSRATAHRAQLFSETTSVHDEASLTTEKVPSDSQLYLPPNLSHAEGVPPSFDQEWGKESQYPLYNDTSHHLHYEDEPFIPYNNTAQHPHYNAFHHPIENNRIHPSRLSPYNNFPDVTALHYRTYPSHPNYRREARQAYPSNSHHHDRRRPSDGNVLPFGTSSSENNIPQSSVLDTFLDKAGFTPIQLPPPPRSTTPLPPPPVKSTPAIVPQVQIIPPTPAAPNVAPTVIDDIFSDDQLSKVCLPSAVDDDDDECSRNNSNIESPTIGRLSKEKRQALDDGYKRLDEIVKGISIETGLPIQMVINRWNRASTRKKNHWNIYQCYFRAHLQQEVDRLPSESQPDCM